jgi:hypothetical protein
LYTYFITKRENSHKKSFNLFYKRNMKTKLLAGMMMLLATAGGIIGIASANDTQPGAHGSDNSFDNSATDASVVYQGGF